ncbi:MAG TPA: diguanylate cyclase [Aromatoleum sp.]|uniref:diguanylate cyclase n=1 Tax=Aromatoleum sp. TaxID=2307007 RepID=UPI002B497590|nr:diguanylate cyclase [Aromatoleum sp.]HJV24045.1 diguanylate cyclase [Aromatoleum sp.]
MKPRVKKSPYSAQWLLLAISLLIIGCANGFDLWVERARTGDREQSRLLTQTRVIQENLVANLSSVNSVLEDLAKEWSEPGAQERATGRLKVLTDAMPGVRTLRILDKQGVSTASNRPELIGASFAYRDYYKRPLQVGDPATLFVLPPVQSTLGVFSVTVAKIIPGPDGSFSGVVVATLDPEYFKTLMISVLYANDMLSAIAHEDGVQFLMVPAAEAPQGKNLDQLESFFTRHRESGREVSAMTGTTDATGRELMIALSTIQPQNVRQDRALIVAVARELDAIYASWRQDAYEQGGLFALFSIGSVFGLYAFQRRQREFAKREAEAAEALAAHQRFLTSLTDNLPSMVGYWNSELRCQFANRGYLEWFGKAPEEMRGIRIQDLMGESLFHKNEPFIRGALRGERQCFERTLTKADGTVGHTWAQYIPDVSTDGGVLGFYVLVSDITELKRTTAALVESERKLRTIVETDPECVKVVAPDGTLMQMNRAGLEMIEASSEDQVVGQDVTRLIAPEYRESFIDLNKRVCSGESGSLEFEIVGLKGRRLWVDTHAAPLRDHDGHIKGQLAVTRDITAQKNAEQELKRLAETDALTNVANRRHFTVLAELEFSRAQRYGGPLSVLMVDIDHFKKVNDTHGHRTGDLVLQNFAELSQKELRAVDIIGRVGGEEFAVILPETSCEQAEDVAERLRHAVSVAETSSDTGTIVPITISVGIACLSTDTPDLETLLSRADRALYAAKTSGRNRTHCYDRQPQSNDEIRDLKVSS